MHHSPSTIFPSLIEETHWIKQSSWNMHIIECILVAKSIKPFATSFYFLKNKHNVQSHRQHAAITNQGHRRKWRVTKKSTFHLLFRQHHNSVYHRVNITKEGKRSGSIQRHFKRTCTHRSSRRQTIDGSSCRWWWCTLRMMVLQCSFKKDTSNVIGKNSSSGEASASLRYLLSGWGFGKAIFRQGLK